MAFAKGFFDLQLAFAEAAGRLSGAPLEASLLDYTNLYVRFGFGRDFNADHEGWQSYLAGLRSAADGTEWTYRYYLREPEAHTAPPVVATFGCFSYEFRHRHVVRLHFRNAESDDRSPLGSAQSHMRRAELAALVAHLGSRVGPHTPIVEASWLYNLRAYRRLFPPAYVSSARPVQHAFRSLPLWGQFVDRRGEIRESMAQPFVSALADTAMLDDLPSCFPLQALTVTAPAHEFFDFYGI